MILKTVRKGRGHFVVWVRLPDGDGGTIDARAYGGIGRESHSWLRAANRARRLARAALDPHNTATVRCGGCGVAMSRRGNSHTLPEYCVTCRAVALGWDVEE